MTRPCCWVVTERLLETYLEAVLGESPSASNQPEDTIERRIYTARAGECDAHNRRHGISNAHVAAGLWRAGVIPSVGVITQRIVLPRAKFAPVIDSVVTEGALFVLIGVLR